MRLVPAVVVAMFVAGCSGNPFHEAACRVTRETAQASFDACRHAATRVCTSVTNSLPGDGWQSWGDVVRTLRDSTQLDELAERRVTEISKEVRHLRAQWRVAKPALTKAVATTARVELRNSVKFVCATASKLPMAASPVSAC